MDFSFKWEIHLLDPNYICIKRVHQEESRLVLQLEILILKRKNLLNTFYLRLIKASLWGNKKKIRI